MAFSRTNSSVTEQTQVRFALIKAAVYRALLVQMFLGNAFGVVTFYHLLARCMCQCPADMVGNTFLDEEASSKHD